MINFAHRGASGYYPENTMLSFRKALEMNCTGIETDVQMTSDGLLVLMHDEKINRTTNGSGYIRDYTYKELKKMNAGSWFDKRFKNTVIPLAEELLELTKLKDIFINLELKTDIIWYKNIEEKVIELINKLNMNDRVIISSFNHKSLMLCKEIDSTIKTAVLYKRRFSKPETFASVSNADAIHPPFYAIRSKNFVKSLKDKGFMINSWTVNSYNNMELLIERGIDGIITDFPDMLNEILTETKYNLSI
jgi:glycerophosphoryl diester phosphodiesterase